MLLTLSTRSLASLIAPTGDGSLTMLRVPDFAMRELQLRGLNVFASMLAGWSLEQLDRLRDHADKAGCPCLALVESKPLELAHPDAARREAALARIQSLSSAANRLACSALALSLAAPDTDEAFDRLVQVMRDLMPQIERRELNVLIIPCEGLTHSPQRLTDLIKRIGGFRIGAMPTFEHAAATGDLVRTLRDLAPYAGGILATFDGFTRAGKHAKYDLTECVTAIRSVGFLNTLAIDYTGNGDAVKQIEQAREILQAAIDAELE